MASCSRTNDLVPAPGCFVNPPPSAEGKIVSAPQGEDAKDTRFVQITIHFTQNDGSALRDATATEATPSAPSLTVVSQVGRTGAYDFLVRVPTRVSHFLVTLTSSCPDQPASGGRLSLDVVIDDDAGPEPTVTIGVNY